MAVTFETVKPTRGEDDLEIYIDQNSDGWIIQKQQDDWVAIPQEDLPALIAALQMARLLLECRDALPAISTTAARLHRIDLSLADRIEDCLEPWCITETERDDD